MREADADWGTELTLDEARASTGVATSTTSCNGALGQVCEITALVSRRIVKGGSNKCKNGRNIFTTVTSGYTKNAFSSRQKRMAAGKSQSYMVPTAIRGGFALRRLSFNLVQIAAILRNNGKKLPPWRILQVKSAPRLSPAVARAHHPGRSRITTVVARARRINRRRCRRAVSCGRSRVSRRRSRIILR